MGGGVQAWRTGESTQPMPAPPYVQGSVWCWFLAPRGFSPATAVPFSPLLRNQHFQLAIRCDMIYETDEFTEFFRKFTFVEICLIM